VAESVCGFDQDLMDMFGVKPIIQKGINCILLNKGNMRLGKRLALKLVASLMGLLVTSLVVVIGDGDFHCSCNLSGVYPLDCFYYIKGDRVCRE